MNQALANKNRCAAGVLAIFCWIAGMLLGDVLFACVGGGVITALRFVTAMPAVITKEITTLPFGPFVWVAATLYLSGIA